jgi:ribosome production factor 2
MNEIGPRFTLACRRDKLGSSDLFKDACKKPKPAFDATKRVAKNLYTDEFGQQKGKVFMQHQDLKTLVTKKWKKNKPS